MRDPNDLDLKPLSQLLREFPNPQKTEAIYKAMREAMREEKFLAAETKETFTLPKEFRKRGKSQEDTNATYSKTVKEHVIDVGDPGFKAWWKEMNTLYGRVTEAKNTFHAAEELLNNRELFLQQVQVSRETSRNRAARMTTAWQSPETSPRKPKSLARSRKKKGSDSTAEPNN
ncbi:hypothetical protein [Deinococcus roseus]|uniref:Uncharacterized protein n=1 Tax=Deinococcus roseus TaxID=392414 RepID=A0ABQ2D7V5_9DEIO|nr:hypothetical protein [Deinococcus roseus]GGJ48081.1 hypothetical protein GCM10008938_37600 [Deinococcus roseus]